MKTIAPRAEASARWWSKETCVTRIIYFTMLGGQFHVRIQLLPVHTVFAFASFCIVLMLLCKQSCYKLRPCMINVS